MSDKVKDRKAWPIEMERLRIKYKDLNEEFREFMVGVEMFLWGKSYDDPMTDKEDLISECELAYVEAKKKHEAKNKSFDNPAGYGYKTAKNIYVDYCNGKLKSRTSLIFDEVLPILDGKEMERPIPKAVVESARENLFQYNSFDSRKDLFIKDFTLDLTQEERKNCLDSALEQDLDLFGHDKNGIPVWEWLRRQEVFTEKEGSLKVKKNIFVLRVFWQICRIFTNNKRGDDMFRVLMHFFAGNSINFPSWEDQVIARKKAFVYKMAPHFNRKGSSKQKINLSYKDLANHPEVNLSEGRVSQIIKEEKEFEAKRIVERKKQGLQTSPIEKRLGAQVFILKKILKRLNLMG